MLSLFLPRVFLIILLLKCVIIIRLNEVITDQKNSSVSGAKAVQDAIHQKTLSAISYVKNFVVSNLQSGIAFLIALEFFVLLTFTSTVLLSHILVFFKVIVDTGSVFDLTFIYFSNIFFLCACVSVYLYINNSYFRLSQNYIDNFEHHLLLMQKSFNDQKKELRELGILFDKVYSFRPTLRQNSSDIQGKYEVTEGPTFWGKKFKIVAEKSFLDQAKSETSLRVFKRYPIAQKQPKELQNSYFLDGLLFDFRDMAIFGDNPARTCAGCQSYFREVTSTVVQNNKYLYYLINKFRVIDVKEVNEKIQKELGVWDPVHLLPFKNEITLIEDDFFRGVH